MDAAIEAARTMPPEIAREDAESFLARVLAEPAEEGVAGVVMRSVVWQYIPAAQRERITAMMEKRARKPVTKRRSHGSASKPTAILTAMN